MQGKAAKDLLALGRATTPECAPGRCNCWTRIKGSEEHYLKEALKDADPDIRDQPACALLAN